MVKIGNGYYFMFIFIAALYAVILFLILRKKSTKTKRLVLTIILFLNLALHFSKLAFEPYRSGLPITIRKITFENICAVSTLLFPFLFLIKKNTIISDYMYFIGICGGLGAMFFPTEAIGKAPYIFDVIRFYICHMNLFTVPLLACLLGLYRPRIKRFWAIPLLFLVHLTIILINEIILIKIGWVNGNITEVLDPNIRNSSFIFGLPDSFKGAKFLFDPFIPPVFKTDWLHLTNGVPYYTPILWMFFPVLIYLPLAYALITAPWWIADIVKWQKIKKFI